MDPAELYGYVRAYKMLGEQWFHGLPAAVRTRIFEAIAKEHGYLPFDVGEQSRLQQPGSHRMWDTYNIHVVEEGYVPGSMAATLGEPERTRFDRASNTPQLLAGVYEMLECLRNRAEDDQPQAVEALASIAARAIVICDQLGLEQCHEIAASHPSWPVLLVPSAEGIREAEEKVRCLDVGSRAAARVRRRNQKNIELPFVQLASRLLDNMRLNRLMFTVSMRVSRSIPSIYREISQLPDLDATRATHEEWWSIAKQILLARYPSPEEIPELKTPVTAIERSLRKSYPRSKIDGKLRSKVIDRIQRAFESLLPSTDRASKSAHGIGEKEG